MELAALCIKIFLVRIIDVSLATVQTIVMVKGKKLLASIIGFIDLFIWFLIVKEALNTPITSIWVAIAYAGGFATGTYIGGTLSDIFISGNLSVQVITKDKEMAESLRSAGYGVSVLEAKGRRDYQFMLFIEINKKHERKIHNQIMNLDPQAFIVIHETKNVYNGYAIK